MNKNDTLVVFYGTTFKKNNNSYYCNGAFGRYIDELAKKYKTIILTVPVKIIMDKKELNDYKIVSNNIQIQELTHFGSYIEAKKKQSVIKKEILNYSEKWNSDVYIRHPNPFTNFVYKLAKKRNLKTVLHLVGDTRSVIEQGTKYTGVVKKIALKYVDFENKKISKIIKNTRTLANGNGLKHFYSEDNKNVKEIRTSTFSENEVINKIIPRNKTKFKLIFVGYLRHEKGLEYLIDALKELENEEEIELTIVGTGENELVLKNKVLELKLEKKVKFLGHVPLGSKLFNIYQKMDLFILPSISEGTPRVLLEAMCNGVPVIATKVGGIPFTIKDGYNGLLIPPKNSKEIVKAIKYLQKNEEARRELILNGINFAKENTLENHVNEVFQFINNKQSL